MDNIHSHTPSTDEMQKEIVRLKRSQALAELRSLRAQQASAAMERTEKILNSSFEKERQFFQLILENTINIILLLDSDGRFAYASDTFLKEAGIANFGLISGRRYRDVLSPIINSDKLRQLSEAIASAFSRKNTVSLEMEQIDFNAKGTPRTFSVLVTPMMGKDGNNAGIMMLFNDITDTVKLLYDLGKRTAELETAISGLETAQHTVTAIFESNPHMNVMFDGIFNALDCNPTACRYMGVDTKEELLSGFAEWMTGCIPPFQSDGRASRSMSEVLMTAAKNGYLKNEIELFIGGKTRNIDLELKRIPYGDSFALLGYLTDISDIREKEEVLAQRTSELETTMSALEAAQRTVAVMFESNPHMNILFDSNFKVIDCNPSAYKFMGFETKQKLLDGFIERISESIPSRQSNGRASIPLSERLKTAADEGFVRFETELHIGNKIKIINTEFKRIPYGDSFAIVGYLMDLTTARERERELIRRDEQLKVAMNAAQAANQAKSAFLANMSHEIRTPMNSIMGFAELALDNEISPRVREYLSKITDSTKWLLSIINDILDISKIESGKMELENVPFDLHGIFTRCQSVIHPDVIEKGLDLHIYTEPTTDKKLLGDPVRLYQALMNLLSNAVKFTSAGTVKMSSSIKSSDDNSATVYFEIKDSGIGMSSEQSEKIFDPFIQADSSTTRNYGGTGLGLAITRNIVDLMGGRLAVESAPGAGSTFSFEIRFKTIDARDDAFEYEEITTIEKPHFDGLILICEDNPMNQQVICEHLANVGLSAVIAENGSTGVDIVEKRAKEGQKPFDLIFMDIFMPVMDGVEASSRITAIGTGTPIVAMTANVMTSELENYKNNGMSGFVGKPFTTQELWRCLLKYLAPVSVDLVSGTDRTKAGDVLQKKLQDRFAGDNQHKYEEIIGAIAAGDIKLAHRLAHTLKSNAGMIGKTALQNAAAEIEFLLKSGTMPGTEHMKSLKTALCAVLEELKPLIIESAAIVKPNAEQAKALIKRLEPMLENINPECVNLLDEIRNLQGTAELVRQIEDYDFESAAQTLSELKKEWM